jgi:hypothetical protein
VASWNEFTNVSLEARADVFVATYNWNASEIQDNYNDGTGGDLPFEGNSPPSVPRLRGAR